MNLNLDRTKKIFLIIGAAVVVLYVLAIVFFTLFGQKVTTEKEMPAPTGTYQPQGSANYQRNRPASLTGDAIERLIADIENRKALPTEDTKIRADLASKTDKKTANVYSSPAFNVRYVADQDLFQIEILTEDIDYARTEAFRWFKLKGISESSICDLPTIFFKNPTGQKGSRLEIYECAQREQP